MERQALLQDMEELMRVESERDSRPSASWPAILTQIYSQNDAAGDRRLSAAEAKATKGQGQANGISKRLHLAQDLTLTLTLALTPKQATSPGPGPAPTAPAPLPLT